MQSILVTGGAGFIGTNFIQTLLSRKPEARIVNLDALTYAGTSSLLKEFETAPNYVFVEGFVEDLELLGALFVHYHFDTVVHFAAETHVDRSIHDPRTFIRSNVEGTYSVLEAARAHWREDVAGKRVHLVSTDEVFGSLTEDSEPTKESSPYAPRSPYAASKASGDHLGMSYYHTYGLPVTLSHGANTFGPFQHPEKLIPLVILKCLNHESIPVYGDGQQVREWLYVQDHCDAVLKILEEGVPGNAYNIGGKLALNNLMLIEKICGIMDGYVSNSEPCQNLIEFVVDRPGHDRRYAVDGAKMQAELNWEPVVDLDEGIVATIDWYLKHQDWLSTIAQGLDFRSWEKRNYLQQ